MADKPMNDRPREIPVSKLILDQYNARLGDPQPDQASTQVALAEHLGSQLFEMANDILTFGTDPSASLIVTPEGAADGKFRVLEGNRRTLAVKALTRPAIIEDALTPARYRRFVKLSEKFNKDPIRSLRCVVFDAEEEAEHWIELRHTGANGGAGLVGWDSNEQDHWKSRRAGATNRKEAGQILDFVDLVYPPRPEDNKRIFSTLQRISVARNVRDKLGIELRAGIVYSHFPGQEILKGLSRVVADLRSGRIKVTDVYHMSDRDTYMATFTADDLPDPDTRLSEPVRLSDLSPAGSADGAEKSGGGSASSTLAGEDDDGSSPVAGGASSSAGSGGSGDPGVGASGGSNSPDLGSSPTGAQRSRVRPARLRANIIPNTCNLWVPQARINAIYRELLSLNVDGFPNACAVTLRVFVELSVDHHIAAGNVMSETERRHTPLAKRMKELAKHLRANDCIDEQLEKAIIKVADGVGLFNSSTTTFNQYVHNLYVYPQPAELRVAWDELEPFMLTLWTK